MALLSEGCNMWVIGELAMFYAGAVNVPLSIKLEESNDLYFRLDHGDVKFVFVSNYQLKKVRAIKNKLAPNCSCSFSFKKNVLMRCVFAGSKPKVSM